MCILPRETNPKATGRTFAYKSNVRVSNFINIFFTFEVFVTKTLPECAVRMLSPPLKHLFLANNYLIPKIMLAIVAACLVANCIAVFGEELAQNKL